MAQGKPPIKNPLLLRTIIGIGYIKNKWKAYERQLKAYNEGKALLDKYGVKY